MATTQLSLDTAASGHILRDYYTSGGTKRLMHLASVHNTMFVMDRSTGKLTIQRDGQEVFRADIMGITSLVAATPALRFTELVNLLVT